MPEEVDLMFAIGLKPEKAIEYFRSKGYAFTWDWHEMLNESHAKAFTVAKAMRLDILEDIRGMVQKSLDEGITLRKFQEELTPKLKAKGWWGPVVGDDGSIAQLGSPYRLRTIYRTNLQTAYMAGKYKAFVENADDRPYWQMVAVMDAATRPSHARLHGKVFRHDDPFWDKFFPPYEFGCRCTVRPYDAEDLAYHGLSVESSAGKITSEERLVSKKTGIMTTTSVYKDPVTGEKTGTGIGWDYNPGKAAWFPELDKYDYSVAKNWITGGLTGPGFKAFYEGEIGGNYPVAVLDEEYRNLIGAKTQTVYLSDWTLKKQKGEVEGYQGHKELTLFDYQKIPEIISSAEVIIEKEGYIEVFIKRDKKYYLAAIKTTESKDELYLLSLRKTTKKDIEREMRSGKVVRNRME